jgi:uncharacterized protein (DUF1697 family)
MGQFVALLRGINVGKGNRVPMAELRELLLSLDYTNVSTLLNSGNVVFKSSGRTTAIAHAERIRAAVKETMSVDVPVIVKSATEFAAIEAECIVANTSNDFDPSRLLVAFSQDSNTLADLSPIAALITPPEHIQIGNHAAYLYCANGILESKAASALLGKIGRNVTTRNWATVSKIVERMETKT